MLFSKKRGGVLSCNFFSTLILYYLMARDTLFKDFVPQEIGEKCQNRISEFLKRHLTNFYSHNFQHPENVSYYENFPTLGLHFTASSNLIFYSHLPNWQLLTQFFKLLFQRYLDFSLLSLRKKKIWENHEAETSRTNEQRPLK